MQNIGNLQITRKRIMKRILILGSGYISGCLVNFLTRVCPTTSLYKYSVTVASIIPKEVQDLANKFPHLDTVLLNVGVDTQKLFQLVGKSDLVISLLPNHTHLPVAEACITLRVNMLHASYNTPEMVRLDGGAKKNGVLILGELGLDPGIDHLLAMKCIHEVQEGRGKVTSFISYCGGLPAPECAGDNPLHYKFSWAPKTALGNLLNGAKFMRDKSIVEIPPGGDILDEVQSLDFLPELGSLEGYPNRDSLSYLEKYGLIANSSTSTSNSANNCKPEKVKVKTMLRGTLRYGGFCSKIKTLVKLGLLSEDTLHILDPDGDHPPISWLEFIGYLLNVGSEEEGGFRKTLSKDEIEILEGLGLLSDDLVDKLGSPLDTLSKHLERTLQFKSGEQDVVVLHHEIEAKYPILSSTESVCGRREFREIDFVVYGDPSMDDSTKDNPTVPSSHEDKGYGYSAMAKTVAYTLGIAAQMMLNGEIKRTGVILPVTKDIYTPILERLANYGLFAIERISEK